MYVSFQELATRVSHRNTGRASNDTIAEQLMARVSHDENLHMIFYRDVSAAADSTLRPTRRSSRSTGFCGTSRCPASRCRSSAARR
ncbi:putative acyl-[acyl-carrier-protein] desaturase desA1 [Mycobacterium kansasii 824]|nr:putative acyl-[acyl-carrier-protein] desaturase desA1 [Mycobacterium kansasii 824]